MLPHMQAVHFCGSPFYKLTRDVDGGRVLMARAQPRPRARPQLLGQLQPLALKRLARDVRLQRMLRQRVQDKNAFPHTGSTLHRLSTITRCCWLRPLSASHRIRRRELGAHRPQPGV